MIILNADFPAGMTIDEAIADALDFSERNHCMLRCNINDVEITIVAGLMDKRKATEYYRAMFDELRKEK